MRILAAIQPDPPVKSLPFLGVLRLVLTAGGGGGSPPRWSSAQLVVAGNRMSRGA